MTTESVPALIACDALAERLHEPDLVVLDASFFLPNQQRDAAAEYRLAHLPGARFFDIDRIADQANPLPHMLPSPPDFASAASAFGIDQRTLVVVYDGNAFMASARAWWMFRVFGHDRIAVLDGGLARWRGSGLPLEAGEPASAVPRGFEASFRPDLVCDLAAMRALVENHAAQIVDARSPGRFAGSEPEPRAGLRGGHLPGSRNVFFKQLLDPETGVMRSDADLAASFRTAGVDPDAPVVTTCGTGVTAAILALALFRLARPDVPVYDGSWAEWGGRDDTPIAMGG